MAWQDEIGPATFRGVPFHVDVAELAGGRRLVKHEYPKRDKPFAEDMGMRGRTLPVEGYVVGSEYLVARDALITALEKEGPGTLVHPYHGTRTVAVDSFRVRETRDRGGIAVFSIDFIETPAQALQPGGIVDVIARVRASASAARSAVGTEFLAKYSPGSLLESAADSLRSATLAINNVVGAVNMEAQKLADMSRAITRFTASIDGLVNSPAVMLEAVLDLFDTLGDSLPDTLTASRKLRAAYDFDPGNRPPGTTTQRLEEQANFDATQRLIQRLIAIQAAESAPDLDFDSYESAIATRNEVGDLLDEQSEVAEDDVFPSLLQLRSDLAKALPGPDSDLPHLLEHTPIQTVPSLVLAHQLYGSLELEQDIVDRNRIVNPGFIVGGHALEVLSDG